VVGRRSAAAGMAAAGCPASATGSQALPLACRYDTLAAAIWAADPDRLVFFAGTPPPPPPRPRPRGALTRPGRLVPPPVPSDTSRPFSRTSRTRLALSPVLAGHAASSTSPHDAGWLRQGSRGTTAARGSNARLAGGAGGARTRGSTRFTPTTTTSFRRGRSLQTPQPTTSRTVPPGPAARSGLNPSSLESSDAPWEDPGGLSVSAARRTQTGDAARLGTGAMLTEFGEYGFMDERGVFQVCAATASRPVSTACS